MFSGPTTILRHYTLHTAYLGAEPFVDRLPRDVALVVRVFDLVEGEAHAQARAGVASCCYWLLPRITYRVVAPSREQGVGESVDLLWVV